MLLKFSSTLCRPKAVAFGRQWTFGQTICLPGLKGYTPKCQSTKADIKVNSNEEDNDDKPKVYSSSEASKWQSRYTFGDVPDDKKPPRYQSIAILASITAFLIYFCILREENDIDELIRKPLYDQIDGLEINDCRTAIKYYKNMGKDTRDLEKRLEQLLAARTQP